MVEDEILRICWLSLASAAGWFLSTLAGGGSPLVLIPALSVFLSPAAVPPVLTVGMLFGNAQRVFIYWRAIDWQVTGWYLPGATIGAVVGAFTLTQIQLNWLPLLLGFFLILSSASFSKESPAWLKVRVWYFLPAGLVYAFLSGLIGSTGPLLNPFYLNYGLLKERMIATKSVNVLVVHIIKIAAYGVFGAFTGSHLGYGLIIGMAAFPGNWLGQMLLNKMSEQQFRQAVAVFVALSGMLILWNQRQLLAFW
ncbi:MAG: sulfite exporter TauE/SafE family protein [Cyanophyceae cyanobacterium]